MKTRSQRCGGGDDGTRSVRRREDERVRDGLEVLARRVPEVEAGNAYGVALAAEHALAERVAERAGLVHFRRTEDAP